MGVYFDRGLWRVQVQKNGRRISTTAGSAEEARAIEARIRRDHFLSRAGLPPERSLEDAITRWLDDHVPQLKRSKDYESHIRALLPYVGSARIEQAPDVWRDYRAANPELTNSTHNRRGAVLRRVCNLARTWGWTTDDIAARIQLLPENAARHTYLTQADVAALVKATDHQPTRDAIQIAAYAGLRISEIMQLDASSVRDGCLYLPTSKSGRPRMIPIHKTLKAAVKRLPIPCGTRWITRHFEAAREALGHPEWRFHDLRHTNASWLIQSGADLVTIRDLLGHSTLAVTGRYAHLSVSHLRTAVSRIGAPKTHRAKTKK